jgi:hypothetical protein
MLQQSAVHLPVPQPRGAALHLTRHAQRRAQQRAIRRDVMGWLLDYGVRCPAGGGVEVVHLTKAARAELAAEIGDTTYRRAARTLATAYAVVSAEAAIVTLGQRSRRIERHS